MEKQKVVLTSASSLIFLGCAVVVLAVDQLSKWVATQLDVPIVLNTGLSGGVAADAFLPVITSLISIVFLVVVVRAVWAQITHPRLVLGMVTGAGLSNIVDRFMYGGVKDWLPVPVLGWRNNVADWVIVLGLGWVAIELLRRYHRSRQHG